MSVPVPQDCRTAPSATSYTPRGLSHPQVIKTVEELRACLPHMYFVKRLFSPLPLTTSPFLRLEILSPCRGTDRRFRPTRCSTSICSPWQTQIFRLSPFFPLSLAPRCPQCCPEPKARGPGGLEPGQLRRAEMKCFCQHGRNSYFLEPATLSFQFTTHIKARGLGFAAVPCGIFPCQPLGNY